MLKINEVTISCVAVISLTTERNKLKEKSWTQNITTHSDPDYPDHKISIKIAVVYPLSVHLEVITLSE